MLVEHFDERLGRDVLGPGRSASFRQPGQRP